MVAFPRSFIPFESHFPYSVPFPSFILTLNVKFALLIFVNHNYRMDHNLNFIVFIPSSVFAVAI